MARPARAERQQLAKFVNAEAGFQLAERKEYG
jgi:hypothetical protein